MLLYNKDYMTVKIKDGYVYIHETYTDTSVALTDADIDGVVEALKKAKSELKSRRIEGEVKKNHVHDGVLVF